ncbi:MAG: hypothetical protein J6X53_05640 [Abditibacteriota bacterium]|nr:hypothetical protein [Abditibacteriota bacterium]
MKNEEIYYAMESVKYACLCSKYGKLREYMDSGNREPTEDYYTCFMEIAGVAADFIAANYYEDYCTETFYFSYKDMMEYYRLCRVYSCQHRIRLRDNPFMREAAQFVADAMEFNNACGYWYFLQTKTNHDWASGIVVYMDENSFNNEFDLSEAMLAIGGWYSSAVIRLRRTLLEEYALRLPALPAHKEAA